MDNSIFEAIKDKIDLVELIREDYPLKGKGGSFRGDGRKGEGLNSLIVTRSKEGVFYFYWTSKGWSGSAFDWCLKQRGMDIKTATKYLAEKANISLPDWTKKESKAWVAQKANEDVMTIASRVFHKWLLKDEAVMNYARGRGWTDESIRLVTMSDDNKRIVARGAGFGFTGYGTAAEKQEMITEFKMNNIDPASPAAVAILGFSGTVHSWAQEQNMMHGITNDDKLNGYLPGFMGRTRFVFPHRWFGQTTYITARNIEKKNDEFVNFPSDPESRKPKSFNTRKEFLGEKKPYYGFNYDANSPHIAIVEGQSDTHSLAQIGVNAVGLCGANLDDILSSKLRKNHKTRYCGMDNDKPGRMVVYGEDNSFPIADLLGPLAQVVEDWGKDVKDPNDLLKAWIKSEMEVKDQRTEILKVLNAGETVAILAAKEAAKIQKSEIKSQEEKNKAKGRAFEIIAKIDRGVVGLMQAAFLSAFGVRSAEYNRGLKLARGEREESGGDGKGHTIEQTFGGFFPIDDEGKEGWLVDYLWDPVKNRAKFAFRDPQGQIGTATKLDIEGVRYFPKVDDNVRHGVIKLPSGLGPEKSTKELLGLKELFFRRSFLLDNPLNYKLAAYWSLGSWVFDCFDETSHLKLEGGHDSGKSAIMLRMGNVCYRTLSTSGLGTAASLKYMKHIYKGLVMMDEVPDNLDEYDDRVVMLNVGSMKDQAWITQADMKKMPDGSTEPSVQGYNVYGPIICTMYGKFPQKATESRFVVFKTFRKSLIELKRNNIPRRLNDQWHADALAMRNMDMTWRLKNWQKRIQPSDDLEDEQVSTRVNQVTIGIKHLVKDDPKALEEVNLVVRAMYHEQQEEQMMSTEARVLDAIVAVLEDESIAHLNFVKSANLALYGQTKYIRYPDLTRVTNWIIDEMNSGEKISLEYYRKSEPDEGGKKKSKKAPSGVTAKTIGKTCRSKFRLARHRLGRGYVVILESSSQPEVAQGRIDELKMKYGTSNFEIEDVEAEQDPDLGGETIEEQDNLL